MKWWGGASQACAHRRAARGWVWCVRTQRASGVPVHKNKETSEQSMQARGHLLRRVGRRDDLGAEAEPLLGVPAAARGLVAARRRRRLPAVRWFCLPHIKAGRAAGGGRLLERRERERRAPSADRFAPSLPSSFPPATRSSHLIAHRQARDLALGEAARAHDGARDLLVHRAVGDAARQRLRRTAARRRVALRCVVLR